MHWAAVLRNATVIAFTASTSNSSFQTVENDALGHMGFFFCRYELVS